MRKSFWLILLFTISISLNAQSIKSMEFHNQEISDILLALGESSKTSILPDETITGRTSFYFSEASLDDALNIFSNTYNLFYEKDGNIIKISKIKSFYDGNQNVSIKADEVLVSLIFKNLSKKIGKTILYDTLPQAYITLDVIDLPVSEVLNICVKKFPDYEVEINDNFYYIKKIQQNNATTNRKSNSKDYLTKSGDFYTLRLDAGRALEVIKKLFELQNQEYSLFLQSDVQLENLYFTDKDFETMLGLILEHVNADFVIKDNIYYLLDLQKRGVAGKLKDTEIITLSWLQASDIPSLLPSELSSNSSLKIDKQTNSILLTGTKEEIVPIKDFISKVDIPSNGFKYKKIDVKYLNAKEIIPLIPTKLIQNQPLLIPNSNSILVSGSNESINALSDFIDSIDQQNAGIPVQLKYIQTETLIKNLPPSISKDIIIDSGYPNLVFYTGSEEKLKLFRHELEAIDKPQPQIKYQLLVIQYSKGKSSSVTPKLTVEPSTSDAGYIFTGELSNIMGLSFDVISKFGYQFAASLNTKIQENTANVFTDTTLTGISGQEIKFQNTDTYRYIEYDYDSSSSSVTRSSSTQQITSGLIMNINGWISGDNMITMNVNATISKQNNSNSDSSKTLTALPSTSERVVTTQVRTRSGEPIIISGLIKEDDSSMNSRTPFISKIPLLGKLFKQTSKTKDKTEIVIYIVPHLIQEYSENDSDSINIKRYYNNFVGKK